MKKDLTKLISQTVDIEKCFHNPNSKFTCPVIYDNVKFQEWKQGLLIELQGITFAEQDPLINETINILKANWNGWNDQETFARLKINLYELSKKVNKYYPVENDSTTSKTQEKPPKIFISHATADGQYIKVFVELLEFIGIQENQLFCSSVPGYNIPVDKNIYDYLKEQFKDYNLHMFYMLSQNYYGSAAALNEMGAAWVLENKYTAILLPDFEYKKIKGAVDPERNSISLDEERFILKDHLSQVKTNLEEEFNLKPRPTARWDEYFDDFFEKIVKIKKDYAAAETNNSSTTQVLNKEVIHLPNLIIKPIENGVITLKEIDFLDANSIYEEYKPLTREDAARSFVAIPQEEIDRYNSELPSQNEISKYISELREFLIKTERYTDFPFNIENNGSCKAHDVNISIIFPDEVYVIDKNELENISKPTPPKKPRNPIQEAMTSPLEQLGKSLYNNMTWVDPMTYSSNIIQYHDDYFLNGNNIKITLHDLQHKNNYLFDNFVVAPTCKGHFKIECSIMCDEYDEPKNEQIEIEVK